MNKMRDDQEFNINFVKIIERERCLYDKTMSEYRSKDMHDQIWKKISTEVKESGKLSTVHVHMTNVTLISAPIRMQVAFQE